ncbi:hypothetical protein GCM10015535_67500 [Streptomyces gelaticus]|uniref:Uncharacterized protein n=1 Tax=Streptomyces gelaticus TaxID=285446 RepID=A0ABQ2W9I1_9ACTN|nr:hypothetical protein GCM10015535_67500 [Streptomyces gelaticus]
MLVGEVSAFDVGFDGELGDAEAPAGAQGAPSLLDPLRVVGVEDPLQPLHLAEFTFVPDGRGQRVVHGGGEFAVASAQVPGPPTLAPAKGAR